MENNNQETQIANPNTMNRMKRTVKMKNLSPKQASLLESAVAGVAGVSIGALFMSFVKPSPEEVISGGQDMDVEIDTDIPFSELPLDNMSFSDAFAAAREELGPSGLFEWHGQTFNTMRADELSAAKSDPETWNQLCIHIDPSHEDATYASEEEILDILNDDDSAIAELDILNDNDDIIIDDNDTFEEPLYEIGDDDEIVLEEDTDDNH